MGHVTMQRYAVGFGLGLLGSWGCLAERINTNHCAYLQGDATCEARHGAERAFCQRGSCGATPGGDGCVAARPEDDACYSPCGGGLSLAEDASCIGEGSTSTTTDPSGTSDEGTTTEAESDSGTEESSTSTGPTPCMSNDDCTDAATPFCEPVGGECMACDGLAEPDAACAELDSTAPLCVGGACVQCTAAAQEACTGTTPVCDDASNTCVPCTAHEQCGEAACNLFTGACLPADAVVHVGPGQRFTSLGAAIDSFGAGAEGTIIVHQANYDEAATVDGGRVLAFLAENIGAGVQPPRWILAGGGSPQLVVSDATVLMDGMQISGNSSTAHPGVRLDGGQAWIDRGRVVTNLGGGIVAQTGAELVLRNCFVGGSVNNEATATVNGATATIVYSTLAAGFGSATAMTCGGAATVDVRNSILVAETGSNEILCAGAAIDYSVTEMNLGGTNTGLGEMQTSWFADYAAGDLHLATAPVSIGNAAQWESGDPLVDIDGEPRPAIDGVPDAAGADVP